MAAHSHSLVVAAHKTVPDRTSRPMAGGDGCAAGVETVASDASRVRHADAADPMLADKQQVADANEEGHHWRPAA